MMIHASILAVTAPAVVDTQVMMTRVKILRIMPHAQVMMIRVADTVTAEVVEAGVDKGFAMTHRFGRTGRRFTRTIGGISAAGATQRGGSCAPEHTDCYTNTEGEKVCECRVPGGLSWELCGPSTNDCKGAAAPMGITTAPGGSRPPHRRGLRTRRRKRGRTRSR